MNMNNKIKGRFLKLGLPVMVFLISFILFNLTYHLAENIFFEKLATAIGVTAAEGSKDLEVLIMNQIKTEESPYMDSGKEILKKYGYDSAGFIEIKRKVIYTNIVFSSFTAISIFLYMKIWERNNRKNIDSLTRYLDDTRKGNYSLDLDIHEDFSMLSDEIYKTVVNLREIKEEAVKGRLRLKDNLSDISHQIKTPITSIQLMTELMESSGSEEETNEYIYRLNSQVERLESLASIILTISKLDADTIEFDIQDVNIKDTIKSAEDAIKSLLEKNSISLSIYGGDVYITGDAYWIREAFLNIIKNSAEYMDDGGEIHIFIEKNPIFTGVIIEDQGRGFLKDDLPYIFNRFYKGKNSNKESIGIGLSMSKAIIGKHGGEITAENRAEGGARFKIKFYNN